MIPARVRLAATIKRYSRTLIANYWSLCLLAVLGAPIVVGILLWLDNSGATRWLIDAGLQPVQTADAARETAVVATGAVAAFITLYFSLTTLVLTIAASSLAVRLIDRWLSKFLVRLSLAGLTFSFIVCFSLLLVIDPDEPISEVPLLSVIVMLALVLVTLAMLAVSLHDLARTMYVDRAIARLGTEVGEADLQLASVAPYDGEWECIISADREGYITGHRLIEAKAALKDCDFRIRFCAAPGEHVIEGQALIVLERDLDDAASLAQCVPIGPYRSDGEGTVFQVRLLVEIAARALSPAVNDFYTAISCVDRLAHAMRAQAKLWIDEGMIGACAPNPVIELPGRDFRSLFEHPLQALRQAAAAYPSVSMRMIENHRRILEQRGDFPLPAGMADWVHQQAHIIGEHCQAVASSPVDQQDCQDALDRLDDAHCRYKEAA